MSESGLTVWTIGHSTRTFAEFAGMLRAHSIELIADVRRFAASRKYPHFNQATLRESLPEIGIGYEPIPLLGGRRRPRPDSHNTVWRNESFRGYADYMETPDFRAGIEQLLQLARQKRTAIMCSEAVWWRCHRSMIADHLKATGTCVRHIMDEKKAVEHPFTSAARFDDGRLTYTPNDDASADEASTKGAATMARAFKVGDHVTWNSEAGHVSGTIIKVHTKETKYKGYTRHASAEEPQYEIKSDKTDHVAMHKGGALKKKAMKKTKKSAAKKTAAKKTAAKKKTAKKSVKKRK